MSGLLLRLRAPIEERIDLSRLVAVARSRSAATDLPRLAVGGGRRPLELGDAFIVSGDGGERITLEGSSALIDGVGAGLDGGEMIVEGVVGNDAGRGMKGGRLEIRGSAGNHLAAGLKGGLVNVTGSAGDLLGAPHPGERFGMAGGTVFVGGDVGERAGDRMRRGTIVVRGQIGPAAGARMMGGTIWTERGFGDGPGPLLRRGTLIGPRVDRLLPTFADCGIHDMVILRILNRYVAETLGPLAPMPLPLMVRRIAGDLATIGKGEILLTA